MQVLTDIAKTFLNISLDTTTQLNTVEELLDYVKLQRDNTTLVPFAYQLGCVTGINQIEAIRKNELEQFQEAILELFQDLDVIDSNGDFKI